MMEVIRIPSTITFTTNDTKQHRNKHLTYGKLKILHTGTTADGRGFAFESLDGLIANLPHTPITGNYIPEDNDFGGHDSIKQVYGFIPEVGDYGLETIDGEEWLVAEVGLFTSVKGGVGDIADQVIGKSHSMELDPEGTEFTVEKINGKFHMTITKATITELCILGDSHQPAFAGSEFFSVKSEQEQLQDLITQYAALNTEDLTQLNFADNSEIDGGVKMENRFLDFMKETYGERFEKIHSTLSLMYSDFYIKQFGDDSVIIFDFDDFLNYRIDYTLNEEGKYDLSPAVEVKERYLTEEEINNLFTEQTNFEEEQPVVDESEADTPVADEVDPIVAEAEETEEEDEVIIETEVEAEVEVEPELTIDELIQRELGMELSEVKEILAANSQVQEEFKRLSTLEKEGALQEFVGFLNESELDSIRENFETLTVADIQKEASALSFIKIKENKNIDKGQLRFSNIVPETKTVTLSAAEELINKYK